ncbi:MAG: insulinase family protein [Pyrinomonadaceae bacterium]|nr:insulinase family protein [Pyrinomonadaceae bacterium]
MIKLKNLSKSFALLLCGALLALPFFARSANAQNQTEDFRRQAPAALPARPLNLPTTYETTLPNGLRVVIVEQPRLPLVSYRLAFRNGDSRDPRDLPGLTDFALSMLTEGTATRTSKQIADEVGRYGATLSAGSNEDYSVVSASSLTTFNDKILDLMADVVLHPSFPQKDFDQLKQNTKQTLTLQRTQSTFLANERLARVIFGEQHPYSMTSATQQSVEAMTREGVMNFYRSAFVPNNAVLFVVGDVKRDRVLKRINELFGGWAKGEVADVRFPPAPVRNARAIYLVDRPRSTQSNIILANTGVTRTSPDYYSVLLMNRILGGGGSARLYQNLRENKGYTYGAYSSLDTRREAGVFRASAEVRSDVTGPALKEFLFEMNRIRTEGITDQELADAKSFLVGIFPLRFETQEGLIDQLVQIKMYNLPEDYLQSYRDRVMRVTKEDVQRAAQKYVAPDKTAIIIVGDASVIADQIKPYAETIEVYDAQGNRKGTNPMTTAGATVNSGSGGGTAMVSTGNTANVIGSWTLEVSLPNGQTLPATLIIKQDNGKTTGEIQAQMANFSVNNFTLNGNAFDGAFATQIQGQSMEGKMTGRVQGDKMDGTITVNTPGFPPLSFTGSRAKQ